MERDGLDGEQAAEPGTGASCVEGDDKAEQMSGAGYGGVKPL